MKSLLKLSILSFAFLAFTQISLASNSVTPSANESAICQDLPLLTPPNIVEMNATVIDLNGVPCVQCEFNNIFYPKNIDALLANGKISIGDTVTIRIITPGGAGGGAVSVVILGGK